MERAYERHRRIPADVQRLGQSSNFPAAALVGRQPARRVEFVSRFADESTLFQLAALFEEALPWSDRKPPIHAGRTTPEAGG